MEELITEAENKGSVSSGGPSRCGTPQGFFNFYMEICRLIYHEDERILGKVIQKAKRRVVEKYYPDDDDLYGPSVIWTLFSDPAIRMKYPTQSTDITNQIIKKEKGYVFPVVGSHIIIPNPGKVTVFTAKGSIIFKESVVKPGRRIKLDNGVYFVRFAGNRNRGTQKVVVVNGR
jgi:hypothetical protein